MTMGSERTFGSRSLTLDPDREVSRISQRIKELLARFKRKGCVVGMSGGIDSSVVAALCVHAVGKNNVLGLFLPEKESSPDALRLSALMADVLGMKTVVEDITPVLEAVGCYKKRDDAIRIVCPEYTPQYKSKIVLSSVVESGALRIFSIVIRTPDGREIRKRLTAKAYLGIVAAMNFKQRTRKMLEYHQADRLNYAVAGTPNRLEYDLGFFVKLGDGAADMKPIAHLYKTQVYQIAGYLGVPEEIRTRIPTTDTYSLPQSQQEFYFSLPYDKMDLCLFGKDNGIPIGEIADMTGLAAEQIFRVFRDIEQKRRTSEYLHLPPQLIEEIHRLNLPSV
jgi:NAD+ synthase